MINLNLRKAKLHDKETIAITFLMENSDGKYQPVLLFEEDIARLQRMIDLCKAK